MNIFTVLWWLVMLVAVALGAGIWRWVQMEHKHIRKMEEALNEN